MCNAYTVKGSLADWARDFEQYLGLRLTFPSDPSNLTWRADLFPARSGLFARPADPDAPEAGLEPAIGRWGLVPFFHKGPVSTFKLATNNARCEDMATKPTFRDAVKRRRCILPCTSFIEWTGPKGSKTKHTITRAQDGPLFLAGLWGSHDHVGERTESYTMVMQAAEGGCDMARFHNRQPVVLTAETARTWLDLNADWREIMTAPPAGFLAFDPSEPVAA